MQEEVPPEVGPRRFYTVEDQKELPLAAQVKELARHLARFPIAVAARDIGGGVGVVRVVLEGPDAPAFARETVAFIHVPKQAAVILVALVAAELLCGIKDSDDVEDQRAAGVVIRIVVPLADLARHQRALLAD